jgi:hypothetical protein
MIRRLTIVLTLALVSTSALVGSAAAQEMHLDLPPGIAKQAQPLLVEMMAHMDEMGMSEAEMDMMMADMQMMAEQLPPGIFLQLVQIMSELEMGAMMDVHNAVHGGDLLEQPPGQVLRIVRNLAG